MIEDDDPSDDIIGRATGLWLDDFGSFLVSVPNSDCELWFRFDGLDDELNILWNPVEHATLKGESLEGITRMRAYDILAAYRKEGLQRNNQNDM